MKDLTESSRSHSCQPFGAKLNSSLVVPSKVLRSWHQALCDEISTL